MQALERNQGKDLTTEIVILLEKVDLGKQYLHCLPLGSVVGSYSGSAWRELLRLVLNEAISSLDVSVQVQILDLLL